MSNYAGQERRAHPRIDANYVVSYRSVDAGYYDFSQTKNVSATGAKISTDKVFERGSQLMMSMRWPFSGVRMEMKAEVVDSRQLVSQYSLCETRVRFLEMPEGDNRQIADFIQQRIARAAGRKLEQ